MKNQTNEMACSVCGGLFEEHSMSEFNEQLLCDACLEGNTTHCTNCNNRIWNDDNSGDGDIPLTMEFCIMIMRSENN